MFFPSYVLGLSKELTMYLGMNMKVYVQKQWWGWGGGAGKDIGVIKSKQNRY